MNDNHIKNMKIQYKIHWSYIFLALVIGSMVATLLFERSVIRKIEEDTQIIQTVLWNINTTHRNITELATLGESVMAWDSTEYRQYHEKRLSIDTLLQDLTLNNFGFVHPEQIDTEVI